MKWKGKRLLMIAVGVYLLILFVASLIILVFFPELLPHRSESQPGALPRKKTVCRPMPRLQSF